MYHTKFLKELFLKWFKKTMAVKQWDKMFCVAYVHFNLWKLQMCMFSQKTCVTQVLILTVQYHTAHWLKRVTACSCCMHMSLPHVIQSQQEQSLIVPPNVNKHNPTAKLLCTTRWSLMYHQYMYHSLENTDLDYRLAELEAGLYGLRMQFFYVLSMYLCCTLLVLF